MKRLPILLLAAAGLFFTLPGAYADTRQCPCLAPPSSAAHTTAITAIDVPKPTVTEAVNSELDLVSLAGADATVEVEYPDINNGDTVGLRWKSTVQQYDAPSQTVSGGAKKVIFKIPNAKVVTDEGLTPRLTASVGIGENPLVISAPEDIKVVNSTPPGQFPPPTLPGLPGNQVDVGQLAGDLTVSVHYPSINSGQIVQVFWEGATEYKSPLAITPDNNPLEFTIPQATVLANLGKPVTLHYETSLNGQPAQGSDRAPVHVSLLTIRDTPIVPDAVAGQLDLKALSGRGTKVTFTYPGINEGHTVGIRWAGTPPYDTPHPPIGAAPRPLEFTIPYDKVRLEKDKTVDITASVGIGSSGLVTSAALPLNIIDSRPSGAQVAADLNTRYNDTREACTNNTPSYYCNGVTIRGTENGSFDPWDPSPTAQRKGSLSFSHLKKGSNVTLLLRNSGFILLSQDEAIAQGTQQEYLCSYPHDAWTDLIGRPAFGCGFQPKANQPLIDLFTSKPELANLLKNNDAVVDRLRNNQDPTSALKKNPRLAQLLKETPIVGQLLGDNQRMVEQWGKLPNLADMSTCAGVGAATLATWKVYTDRVPHPANQCSLSTQFAAQFDVSLKARQYPMPVMYSTWNELLIKVWPTGIPAQLPMQALYYQNATGLPEARVYQQKYAAKTGGMWLPVIKFDMTQLNGNPFSYNPTDQALQP